MTKQFTMSMYVSTEELYKAKAAYYKAALDKLWELHESSATDEADRDITSYMILADIYCD